MVLLPLLAHRGTLMWALRSIFSWVKYIFYFEFLKDMPLALEQVDW